MSATKRGIVLCGIFFGLSCVVVVTLIIVAVCKALMLEDMDSGIKFEGVEYTLDDTQLQKYIAIMGNAIKFKSVSTAPGKYDSEELLKLQKFLIQSFPKVFNSSFIDVEVINQLSLLLTIKGSNSSILPFMLTSHLDVVPVDPEQWTLPPFGGNVVPDPQTGEDCIWGRGAIDDKAGVVGILSSLDLLLKDGWTPKRSFYVAFGHDEEVSGLDGAGHIGEVLLERGVTLDFLLDEGMPIVQGVMTGIEAPIALIGVTEKGRMDAKISVEGEGGHSSIPPKSQAVEKIASALANLYKYPQPSMFGTGPEMDMLRYLAPKASWPYKLLFGNTWLFRPLLSYAMSQKSQSNALLRTTTAVTIVRAGIKENVVPASAYAIVNHRIHPSQSLEDVLAHDRSAIGDDQVKIEMIDGVGPHPVSSYGPDSIPYSLIAGAVKHVYPEAVPAPGIMVANTDSRHYLKLTKNIYRLLPFVLTASQIGKFHAKDENLSVKNFAGVIKFFTTIILGAEMPFSNAKNYREL